MGEQSEVKASARRVRRWIRRSSPGEGWWPWGALYVAALIGLVLYSFLFFAPFVVEAQTVASVQSRLTEAGVEGLEVEGDGQRVRIRGAYPEGRTAEGLIAMAEAARCDTALFGPQVCPTLVQASLTRARPAAPVARPLRAHDFTVAWSGTQLGLRGEVPDSGVRRAMVARARAVFADFEVSDALRATGDRASDEYAVAFERALAVLPHLEDGTARWQASRLSVLGNVRASSATVAEAAFHADAGPPLGALVLTPIEEVDKCDRAFEAVLASSTIYFDTNKADISARSEGVLRRLASIAGDCDGDLIIEGHADASGREAFNRRLSLRRARAVVLELSAMGINPARLHPRGLGISRPAADNTTPTGRAKNRRIEIRVQRTEL